MCGLVGVAGDLSANDLKAFNNLLYLDYLRGTDSTGVASVSAYSKEVSLIKAPTDPLGLMALKGYDSAVSSAKCVLMGHNRAATRGKVTRYNAHPFHIGNVIMAHNGTLDFGCLRDLVDGPEGDTDSEQIAATIAGTDLSIEAIKDTIAKMSGAWALSIYDKSRDVIHLVRNDQRPLFYAMSESKKTLYWASEAWMLNVVLHRNSIKFTKVVEVTVDTILSWEVPVKTGEIFSATPGRTKAEGKESTNFREAAYGYGRRVSRGSNGGSSKRPVKPLDPDDQECWTEYGEGWQAASMGEPITHNPFQPVADQVRYNKWNEGFREQKAREKEKRDKETPGHNVLQLEDQRAKKNPPDLKRGPSGKWLNAREFREVTNNECGWCNNPITIKDDGFFIDFGNETVYVCSTHGCTKDKTLEAMKREA